MKQTPHLLCSLGMQPFNEIPRHLSQDPDGTSTETIFIQAILQAILSSQMPTPCSYDLTLHEMCQAEEVAW